MRDRRRSPGAAGFAATTDDVDAAPGLYAETEQCRIRVDFGGGGEASREEKRSRKSEKNKSHALSFSKMN